ncbi:MAG: DUF4838 domain-containing protein [Armatimonadetes bacterium]|nr:DUF4838 domain-containing protein [Armatimonadota bacterium]
MRALHSLPFTTFGLLLYSVALGAPNIYPDPGFETSGQAGKARTGERAGYLAVGGKSHWGAIGGAIEVEPFARYRVSLWYQARTGQGTFFAPYCYGWDSYEWAFAAFCPVPTTTEWAHAEVTFVTPNKTMYVHPLAYMDAADSEGWVDDIVVEKIAEPAETMAEIEARSERSPDDMKLLARWYVKHGNIAGAEALMNAAEGPLRADLATVLAKATKDPVARLPYVVQVVAYGGPTYHEGMARFGEMTADMTRDQKLAIAAEAARLNPEYDRCGQAVRLIIAGNVGMDPLATVAEGREQLREQRQALESVLAAIPADSLTGKELREAMASVQEASDSLAERRRELGHCRLAINGQSLTARNGAIVIPDQPTASEQYAARDLRYHLELITGRVFPIRSEAEAAGSPGFYVGRTRAARQAGVKLDGLGLEGLHIKTVGPAVILAGNQRGVLYAVYTFLQDNLGCRWFTPDCSTWPRSGELAIADLNRRYIPPLEFRMGDYPVARNGTFAARLRLNGDNHGMSPEQGGQRGVMGLAHTFAALVPPEKYYAAHPEYFSLVGGRRQSGYSQLCLTNPDVLKLCIQGVRQWIKDHPDKKVFSVSQNDTHGYCECEECTKVAEAEGSQSGPMVRFVNAIADDIAKDYPDVAIETLAYQYTRKPPKLTKPRPNVIICLCSIECCFIHPLGTDEFNRSFADDIRGWNRICDRLWIWDYIINYAHSICPFPNLYVLKPNINFFLENGVKGIYEESCYYTRGSELQELRNYIMAQTLWDPSYDTDQAIDEFCAAYYGAAAGAVREYINLIHRETQSHPDLHVTIYTHPRSYVTPGMISQAEAIFDRAEAAVADDPVLLHRVQVARLPIMYAAITLGQTDAFTEADGKLVQQGGTDVSSLVDRFAAIARAEGVTMIREGGSFEAWLAGVPRQPRDIPIETLRNGTLELKVLPLLGGRLYRLIHLPSGADLLYRAGSEGAVAPLDGGYEEYSGSGYRSPGWNEAYAVTARSSTSLTLQADLGNGLRLTRVVSLEPDQPVVAVSSTLTNISGSARTACLRAHPEFAVRSLAQASARVLRPDGSWQTIKLPSEKDPAAEVNEFLSGEDVPAGAWAVVDEAAGLAIVNRFERVQVSQALLNRSGSQNRVNLELYSLERELQPGESLTLQHTYEVLPVAEMP